MFGSLVPSHASREPLHVPAVKLVVGLVLAHVVGALFLSLVGGGRFVDTLRSPHPIWAFAALAYATGLGLPIVLALLVACLFAQSPGHRPTVGFVLPLLLGVLILVRPWVPLYWDEWVWLAKTRIEAQGLYALVAETLSKGNGVVPQGYPTLWPALVAWVSLFSQELAVQVAASAALVALAVLSLLSGLKPAARALWMLAVVCAPLVLVHARSAYADLLVGLLAAALLIELISFGPTAVAVCIAFCLVGLKDEGAIYVFAVTLGALTVDKRFRMLVPLIAGGWAFFAWRWLLDRNGIAEIDHTLIDPHWERALPLAVAWAKHATDGFSFGLFWPIALARLAYGLRSGGEARAVALATATAIGLLSVGLIAGSERMWAFAEGGTLLGRLLVQLAPLAALGVFMQVEPADTALLGHNVRPSWYESHQRGGSMVEP